MVELIEQAEARNAIACADSHARLRGGRAAIVPFNSGFLVSAGSGALLRWERAGAGGSRAPKWRRWKGFFEPTPRWDSFHYARAQRRSYIVSFMSSGIEAATS